MVCTPIAHAVNKPKTVDFALPLGPNRSILAPAIRNKQLLSISVMNCLCQSLWCAAGGLFATYSQKNPKSSRAFVTSSKLLVGLSVWFLAAAQIPLMPNGKTHFLYHRLCFWI